MFAFSADFPSTSLSPIIIVFFKSPPMISTTSVKCRGSGLLKEKVSANDVSEFLNLFKTNASNFDWGGFTQKLSEEFFKNKTRDAQISNKKMESFLKENDQILEDFAEEHFKKIQLFEQEESSK